MNFLAPIMLWGSLAAGVPIALHLFFRSRYRLVPWAAMKFLLTSIEQTSRRLKFQELLLLLMRCLVLILLAVALARPLLASAKDFTFLMLVLLVPMGALMAGLLFKPVLGSRAADIVAWQGLGLVMLVLFWLLVPSEAASGGGGAGVSVDAVFVFDTSFSMGASDGAVTRFERAKAEALRIIDQLPAYSTVQVIACADRAELLGPRSPANLDQARHIIQNLQLTSLATDLYPGVVEAAGVLQRGQASNKELYIFSDMQRLGWEQQAGGLARVLQEVKDKATVFLVRCGSPQRKPANVALVGITPQSGMPRPGERVAFAVLLRNTGSESVKDLKVSLSVDGNDKLAETQALARIDPGETRAVTLSAKLEKAGLRLLTARVEHDDLEGDNRFDQVLLVRDQINILVIDGGAHDRDPEKSSSFFLMHALLPVKDSDRAKYHVQARLVSPRLASPALLAKQDLCILVNVALKPELKRRAEAVPADFIDELERFVRQGHGLVIYAGDNVSPDLYNEVLGKKHGLLPMPIKGVVERKPAEPLRLLRNSVGLPAYLKFKEDEYYKGFNEIQVWKTLELKAEQKKQDEPEAPAPGDADKAKKEQRDEPLTIALKYGNGLPAVVSKKVEAGEVIFVATAAEPGFKADSPNPVWNDWALRLEYVPFVEVTVNHLLHGQTQTHNVTAGEKLDWYVTTKQTLAYTLVHPDGKAVRLGLPEKKNNRALVTVKDLPSAGVYRMQATRPPQAQGEEPLVLDAAPDKRSGAPLAVIPNLRESEDLSSLSDGELDQRLGFRPVHLVAGVEAQVEAGTERLNREWTTWLLALVLALTLGESALAYWCGRAW